MRTMHAKEQSVKDAISSDNRRKAFALLRNKGILQTNQKCPEKMEVIKTGKDSSKLATCKTCLGSYCSTYFHRHIKSCAKTAKAVPTVALSLSTKVEGFGEILASFQHNIIGDICRSDETLRYIGERLYLKDKSRVDKQMEVKKSVMADMRCLARIFHNAKLKSDDIDSVGDMFKRENFSSLREAIEDITTEDCKLKYGLKTSIYYLLHKSAKVLEGRALETTNGESVATEMRHFQTILKQRGQYIWRRQVPSPHGEAGETAPPIKATGGGSCKESERIHSGQTTRTMLY